MTKEKSLRVNKEVAIIFENYEKAKSEKYDKRYYDITNPNDWLQPKRNKSMHKTSPSD